MGFVKKADCKLSISNASAIAIGTYKMKNIFLLMSVVRWYMRALPFWILNLTFFYYIFSKKRSFSWC